MRFKLNSLTLVVTLILLQPFMFIIPQINELGFQYENIHMGLILLLMLGFSVNKMLTTNLSLSIIQFSFISILLILIVININNLRYFKGLYFFTFIAVFYTMTINWKSAVFPKKILKVAVLVFYISSFVYMLYRPDGYRFQAYIASPTVYSVFVGSFFTISLFTFDKIIAKVIFYLFSFYLTVISETRLNLLFISLIPVILWILDKKIISKKIIFLLFNIFLISVYPIYSLVIKTSFVQSILKIRYDGSTEDASFNSRADFNHLGATNLFDGSIYEILFGKGAGFSRILMNSEFPGKLMHNDYIRLSLDYGIVFTIIFLLFLYRISNKNNLAFISTLLYLFTFYHNMVYSLYFFSLILLFSKFYITLNKNINK